MAKPVRPYRYHVAQEQSVRRWRFEQLDSSDLVAGGDASSHGACTDLNRTQWTQSVALRIAPGFFQASLKADRFDREIARVQCARHARGGQEEFRSSANLNSIAAETSVQILVSIRFASSRPAPDVYAFETKIRTGRVIPTRTDPDSSSQGAARGAARNSCFSSNSSPCAMTSAVTLDESASPSFGIRLSK